MATNSDVVRRGYEAFNRGDMTELFRTFAPDVEWTSSAGLSDLGIGGVHKGREEVASFFGRLLPGVFAELRVEAQQFIEQADTVVVLGIHHVRTMSGVAANYRFVHVWTVSDGLATRFEDFIDTAMVRRLLEGTATAR